MLVFVLQFLSLHWVGNSDHVVVSVSIDFQTNSKQDTLFQCIAYGYSHADGTVFVIICEMFHVSIPLKSVLLLTPCKAEQPQHSMELKEKEQQKDESMQKVCLERTNS